jgi:hypothetical protein
VFHRPFEELRGIRSEQFWSRAYIVGLSSWFPDVQQSLKVTPTYLDPTMGPSSLHGGQVQTVICGFIRRPKTPGYHRNTSPTPIALLFTFVRLVFKPVGRFAHFVVYFNSNISHSFGSEV